MAMAFQLIDIERWERREFYEHFVKEVVCTYSATVNLDISCLQGERLYPAMIWLITKTVNEMPEFRTSLTKEGLGVMTACTRCTRCSIRKTRKLFQHFYGALVGIYLVQHQCV